jgi:hypothetical protein
MRELQNNEINAIAGGMGAFEIIVASSIVALTIGTLITDYLFISELSRSNALLDASVSAATSNQ